MRGKVLKLNSSYIPIDIVDWQDAITDWVNGRVEIVEHYDDLYLRYGYDFETKECKGQMQMPAVVRCVNFNIPKKHMMYYKPFSRKNVYERDDKKCQYCGTQISISQMTYDHVIPRSKGGITEWSNIVSCCKKCNIKKADRTCSESGMHPIKKPVAPIIADGYIGGMVDRVKFKMGDLSSNEVWSVYIEKFN